MIRFTPQETKLIERLRKQERQWPRMRWMWLVAAVFLMADCGFFLLVIYKVLEAEKSSSDNAFIIAFFWPKCLLMFCLATLLIILAIRDWHGNVQRMLLLRLLDDRQKETTGADPAAK
jgi:hypothetical protein